MAQKSNGSAIQFEKKIHNYDTIMPGSDGECHFIYTNTGCEPLIITSVSSSCGCTTAGWNRSPLLPGQKGMIDVKYNTEISGSFQKTIVVKSNAANAPTSVLRIRGFVREKPKRQAKGRQ